MKDHIERNLGKQPIADIMKENNLNSHDLVAASTEQITHKMVTRACKGRKLTPNVRTKIINSLNKACKTEYKRKDLFTY